MEEWAGVDLAWEPVDIAGRRLSERNPTDVCTAIGAGDSYAAIDTLLTTIAHAKLALSPMLLAQIIEWLNAYAHHSDSPRLHELLTAISGSGQ